MIAHELCIYFSRPFFALDFFSRILFAVESLFIMFWINETGLHKLKWVSFDTIIKFGFLTNILLFFNRLCDVFIVNIYFYKFIMFFNLDSSEIRLLFFAIFTHSHQFLLNAVTIEAAVLQIIVVIYNLCCVLFIPEALQGTIFSSIVFLCYIGYCRILSRHCRHA